MLIRMCMYIGAEVCAIRVHIYMYIYIYMYVYMGTCICWEIDRNTFMHAQAITENMFCVVTIKEPPVGFEPTTSRLLSGCSAN